MDLAFPAYLALAVLGLLTCVAGYRLFRALLGVWGFLGGAALALAFLQGSRFGPLVQVVAAVIAGVAGAILVSVLYWVGVFLVGVGAGLAVAAAIEPHWHVGGGRLLELVLALGGGVAALVLQRVAITLFTALGGAWVAVTSVAALLASCPLETFPARCPRAAAWAPAILGAWILLSLVGAVVQSRGSPGRASRADD